MLPWPEMPKIHLDQADVDDQVEKDGIDTLIRRAIACDCYDDETRQPDSACPECDGWGMLYDPDDEVTTKVIWQSHSVDTEWRRTGTHTGGSTQVTWRSSLPLGRGAMFVSPLEESVVDNEILKRGETDPTGASLERLRYRLVTAVEVVRTSATIFEAGVDYNLNGQAIEWLPGRGPASGSLYAVRYRHRTHFVIEGSEPKMRDDDGQRLAFTCTVRRFPSVNRQAGPALGQT